MTAVVGIAGWKNSGKTTLAVKVIGELKSRGYRVVSIKHAHHDADIDHENTDSYRHRAAGAVEVALVTATRWAIIHELHHEPEPPLADILAKLAPADIVIVEGYKWEAIPKIEVRRQASAQKGAMAPGDRHIIAIATDDRSRQLESAPVFDLDDFVAITDFVIHHFDL